MSSEPGASSGGRQHSSNKGVTFATGVGLIPECLRDQYAELDDALTVWGEVEVAALRTTSPTGG
ncbi:hypothetical protein AB0393_13925 [Streptomyces cyaneofuscatus]|uniref:hypothetical protein n=1 Tax=Streptomyces TaxID=1883 RepID=UPI002241A2B6|nr:hypothetical protein [Streptomyces sp. VB1]UZI28159.1 hypothetical protein OH133_08440 [Streptomyces sp. VB1]